MEMSIGKRLRVTLFGESHGKGVGALVQGIPAGIIIDEKVISKRLFERKPGGKLASPRKESDSCEIKSGILNSKTTGNPILLWIENNDVRSNDYSFLPKIPRPGHADLPSHIRSEGHADLRGGGIHSGRLTAPLVASAGLIHNLKKKLGFEVFSQVSTIGKINAKPIRLKPSSNITDAMKITNCKDEKAAEKMYTLIKSTSEMGDSIGSTVEVIIMGLPIGVGEPWFDGLEPTLSRALMAIPAARAIEFGEGVNAVKMHGSEHNDSWIDDEGVIKISEEGDGALGGFSTGSPLRLKVHFKPPSSISKTQKTLNLESGKQEELSVKGRHDPVIGPRAAPVVKSVCELVIADLILRK
ncbi:MAG: chorismate synthase [Methanobacteriota archaeon]|nr:MAG: chorismate synthase [Euryarchaeota archaeon]|tara:strand:+ start:720 stop:1784 length:1065 start_codon:yes stop_codon:yes gene_type:complete